MATFKKFLKPGAILATKSETYVYLGHYVGTPRSMYTVPDEGYLYLFFRHSIDDPEFKDWLYEHIVMANRFGFDGFACYTKNPKQFESLIGKVDITPTLGYIQHIYGLTVKN